MTKPVVSRNGKIAVPYSKTDKAWVCGPAKHPGPNADAEALQEAHKRRLTKSRAKAQLWADRAERAIEGVSA